MNEVERQAERARLARQNFDQTLAELKRRLTPGELVEDVAQLLKQDNRGIVFGLAAIAGASGSLWFFNRFLRRKNAPRRQGSDGPAIEEEIPPHENDKEVSRRGQGQSSFRRKTLSLEAGIKSQPASRRSQGPGQS